MPAASAEAAAGVLRLLEALFALVPFTLGPVLYEQDLHLNWQEQDLHLHEQHLQWKELEQEPSMRRMPCNYSEATSPRLRTTLLAKLSS